MNRLTDNDKHFGPITYARVEWHPIRLVWSSGGDNDSGESLRNTLTAYAFGWVVQINLPKILRPYRIKHVSESLDAATVARLGRNWYYEIFPREYGFSICDGFLQVFLGAQTHDSTTTQSWSKFLPWTQWRHVRFSLYKPDGEHFWTQLEAKRIRGLDNFRKQMDAQKECPSVSFEFDDYDGQRIVANCQIHEREWHFGEGWFKWLRFFRKPMIRRSLNIEFDKEVGPEKGSWKGGTIGTGIEMIPDESCEAAFRRYCEQEHRSKYRNFRINYVGAAA
jgi:hypothetical protein